MKEAIDPKKGSVVVEDNRRRAIGRGGEHSCFVGCWKRLEVEYDVCNV
jgi:hypothetical protein